MSALRHRAIRIREFAANEIRATTVGQSQILSELVTQAFGPSAVDNPFLAALKRLGEPACRAAETQLESHAQQPQAERLLAHLGSHRYFDDHLACLTDPDPMRVRYAMARLADIGDPAAVDSIHPLLQHPHLNVQFDARTVLAGLTHENGDKSAVIEHGGQMTAP